MFSQGLSLDQAPPIGVILRFFVTAVFFGLLFSLYIFWGGREIFIAEHPFSLAAIHLFFLGVVMMTMFGALFQMLPVLAGVSIHAPQKHAAVVHTLLSAGVMTIFIAFISFHTTLFMISATLLALAIVYATILMLPKLLKQKGESVRGMQSALIMLFFVLLIALILISKLIKPSLEVDFLALKAAHYTLALLGWVVLLIVAVAFQVIEMFYVTPSYPKAYKKSIWPLAILLFMCKVAGLFFLKSFTLYIDALLGLLFLSFIILTLLRLKQRKRPVADATLKFWVVGLLLMAVALVSYFLECFFNIESALFYAFLAFSSGVLAILVGMMYKIVPFLVWFHLNSEGYFNAPMMQEVITPEWAHRSLYLYLMALAALAALPWVEGMVYLFGALIFAFFCSLGFNLLCAIRRYSKVKQSNARFEMPEHLIK